ncbi:MAG: hypothetical protein D6763_03425 [Alphaproteobacteria bacterium]|nr:MAG: hypothetical protein D6763_03425 [Alphaproteobacteria bacterium]
MLIWQKWRGEPGTRPGVPGSYVATKPFDETLPPQVFAAELESINARRKRLGLPEITDDGGRPHARHGLAGLALSGGGIRSATFNLGVVQTLARNGVLAQIDYLSTVSGGGYLGACLSSCFASAPADSDIVISGVPRGAALRGATLKDDDCWHVSAQSQAALELTLPCATTPQTIRLWAESMAPDGRRLPATIRPRGALPDGVVVTTEHGKAGSTLRIQLDGDAAGHGLGLSLAAGVDAFPFHHCVGVPEGAAFRHLRDNSNYLTPRKFLAGLRLPALFLRGLLVNFLILLPLLLGASLLTLWIAGGEIREALLTEERTVVIDPREVAPWLISSDDHANRFDLDLDILLAGPTPLVERYDFVAVSGLGGDIWPASPGQEHRTTVIVPTATPVLPLVLRTAATTSPRLTVHAWKESAGTGRPAATNPTVALRDRVFSSLRWGVVAVLGLLALYPVFQWLSEHVAGRSWATRDWLTRYLAGGAVLAIALTGFVTIQPLAITWLHALGSVRLTGLGDGAEVTTMASAILLGAGVLFSGPLAGRASGLAGRIGLVSLAVAGPLVVWLFYLGLCRWALIPATAPGWLAALADALGDPAAILTPVAGATGVLGSGVAWLLAPLHDGWQWSGETSAIAMVYGLVGIMAFLVTRFFYDVNATSFHHFYRDRLSKAYLVDPWTGDGTVRHNDRQLLSGLDEALAPYHLINTTLNIQTSKGANLRGRGGAFFTFSRNYVGGPLTGYRATTEMEALHPPLDLGTAVAISGAAAAPNMGAETHRALTFVLTLLNIRLGYWLPHPRAFSGDAFRVPVVGRLARTLLAPLSRVTPVHLLREMMGLLDETGRHINLTDGGHLENLGIYELLRRRCRLIIACDGEADPDMTFKGLANAIRLARIDLGITIDLDVDALRPSANGGWSAAHGAIGRINYGAGDYGYLVYIKSSMTGDEPVSIRKYRDDDPDFPHQTTADQFFDEAQFEAYRALGHHVGEAVLGGVLGESSGQPGAVVSAGDVAALVDRVAARYAANTS